MQRLLENHSGDQEFSQARLLDEDASMKNDLRTMKAGLSRKRQLSSGSSTFNGSGSNFNGSRRSTPATSGNDSDGSDAAAAGLAKKKPKAERSSSDSSNSSAPAGGKSAFANCGSLSIALRSNRQTKKRQTSFLGGKRAGASASRAGGAGAGKSVAVGVGHVLFNASGSDAGGMSRSASVLAGSASRSGLGGAVTSSRGGFSASGKRPPTGGSGSQSLWSAVTANGFQNKRARTQ